MSIIHKLIINTVVNETSVSITENVTKVMLKDNSVRKVTIVKISDSKGIKGNPGLNSFEFWLTLPGNEGKTIDDYNAFYKGEPGEDLHKTLEQVRLEDNRIDGDIDAKNQSTVINIRDAVDAHEPAALHQVEEMRDEAKSYADTVSADAAAAVTLEQTRQNDNELGGNIDAAGNTIDNLQNAIDPQQPATLAQIQQVLTDAKNYTDTKTVDAVRWVAYWDATGGIYPTGFPGGQKRGDEFEANNATVVLMPDGQEVQKGDVFRARINAPGQNPLNWSISDGNAQQATELNLGLVKIAPQTEAQNINSTDDKTAITPLKHWIAMVYFKTLVHAWDLRQIFTTGIRLPSLTNGQYLRVDASKDVIGQTGIPASDITTLDATHRWWTDALATTLSGKENSTNKQNSLATDGTGAKFPTVDATNAGLALKQEDLWTFQRTKGIYFFEDFLGGGGGAGFSFSNTLGIGSLTSGTGAGSSALLGRNNGWRSMFTGTTATGQGGLSYGGGGTYYTGSGAMTVESLIEPLALSISTDRYFYINGFLNATSNYVSPGSGIFFLYDEGNVWGFGASGGGLNWKCVTLNGSGRLITTTAVPVALNGQYKLRIEINSAGTSVEFYINNVLVATHTTFIPIAATGISWLNILNKSVGTTSMSFGIDFLAYRHLFAATR